MVKKASGSPTSSQDLEKPTEASGAPEKTGVFASLASANFRWYWTSNLAASFTMQMRQIARGWLVYSISESPIDLALVMAAFGVPMTLLSPVGGALADRFSKRTLISVTNLIGGLSGLIIGILILSGDIAIWHLFLVGFLDGLVSSFNMPSRQGMLPSLVDRDRLVNAVALSTGAMNVSRILAPALAGLLISVIEMEGVYFVMAALNVVAALTILRITLSGTMAGDWKDWGLRREVFRGLSYVATNRALLWIILLAFGAIALGMSFQVLLPAFVVEAMEGDSLALGILLAVSGVGALIGSLGLAAMGNPRHKGAMMVGAIVLWAVALLGFSLSRNLIMASAMLFVVGFAVSVFMSVNMALLQLLSSREMHGRVMSISMMTWGMMPLGVIPLSILAERINSTPNALTVAAIVMFAVAVVFPLLNRTVRRLDV